MRFMTGYEDSPETTFVGQTVQYGYATIRDRYKKAYATPAAMGKLTFSHLAIRILDSGYAIATGNFHLERNAAGGGNADGIFSLLLRKESQAGKLFWTTATEPAERRWDLHLTKNNPGDQGRVLRSQLLRRDLATYLRGNLLRPVLFRSAALPSPYSGTSLPSA